MRIVAATVVLLAAGLCQAEEKTLFQEYGEAHVGHWEGETTLVNDVPGLGAKGDKITLLICLILLISSEKSRQR